MAFKILAQRSYSLDRDPPFCWRPWRGVPAGPILEWLHSGPNRLKQSPSAGADTPQLD